MAQTIGFALNHGDERRGIGGKQLRGRCEGVQFVKAIRGLQDQLTERVEEGRNRFHKPGIGLVRGKAKGIILGLERPCVAHECPAGEGGVQRFPLPTRGAHEWGCVGFWSLKESGEAAQVIPVEGGRVFLFRFGGDRLEHGVVFSLQQSESERGSQPCADIQRIWIGSPGGCRALHQFRVRKGSGREDEELVDFSIGPSARGFDNVFRRSAELLEEAQRGSGGRAAQAGPQGREDRERALFPHRVAQHSCAFQFRGILQSQRHRLQPAECPEIALE